MNTEQARQLSKMWRQHEKGSRSASSEVVVGFASSFTIDPLVSLTGGLLLQSNVCAPRLANADYNQLFRVCLDPSAEFAGLEPHVLVLIWRLEDLVSAPDSAQAKRAFDELITAINTLRSNYAEPSFCRCRHAPAPAPRVLQALRARPIGIPYGCTRSRKLTGSARNIEMCSRSISRPR